MNIFAEFSFSMAWAVFFSIALRQFINQDMELTLAAACGVMGGVIGWLSGAILADHVHYLFSGIALSRTVIVGVCVATFVAAFQIRLGR
jgi:hypothetical protein